MTEHNLCQEWYCDPDKVVNPELKAELLLEGPHCEACGYEWPCTSSTLDK